MFLSNLDKPIGYTLIDSPKKVAWIAKTLLESEEFAFDIETNHPTSGKIPDNFIEKIAGISFSWGNNNNSDIWKPGKAVYIPLIRQDDSDYWNNKQEYVISVLKEILESFIPKVAQNGKFDVKKLFLLLDIRVKEFVFDTMLAHSILDEARIYSSHALKSETSAAGKITKIGMSDVYLDTSASRFKEGLDSALDFYDPYYRRYSKVPLDILYLYGCADSDLTLCLKHKFSKMIIEEDMEWLFDSIVMKLNHRLMLMELHGVPLDIEWAKQVKVEQEQIMDENAELIYSMCGKNFDIGSPTQLGRVLFEDMRLPGGKKNKQGWITDIDHLRESAIDHPIIDLVLKWRRAQKIVGSFVVPALERVQEITNEGRVGWVHTTYYQDSLTGRLKGSDPNLTALPRPENGGEIVKSIWAGGSDYVFIFCDYSQIELRMIAHCSREPLWIDGFNAGHDMHSAMAQRIWYPDLTPDEVKKRFPEDRSNAKAINFGIAFGKSEYNLAKDLGLSVEEAYKLIHEEYFGAAPILKGWIDTMHEFVRMNGYVYNIFGRKRHLPDAQIDIPQDMYWPKRDVRPGCYRFGIKLEYLGVDTDDMHNLDDSYYVDLVRSKNNNYWNKCLSCKYIKSCIVNTEVKRISELVGKAMRQAVNAPIQGGATDMLSLALVWVGEEIENCGYDAAPILHIHDEMVVFSHVDCAEQVLKIMKYNMCDRMKTLTNFSVPLTVDTAVVSRWSDKHHH